MAAKPNQQGQYGQGPSPLPIAFARTPVQFAQNQLLNYAEKRDIELYKKGATPLKGGQWDGKHLHTFLVRVREKARQYVWMPLLTFCTRNLINNYGEVTHKEVHQAAQVYLAANN
jgi:hypothetical protein